MARIQPFVCLRPNEEYAPRVAALPYDVYSTEEARAVIECEPLSFLKVDRAETSFSDTINPYEECVYEKAADLLNEYKREGIMIVDTIPSYYIYQLEMEQRVQTGIVACASVKDYETQVIRTHENTRSDKEQDRIRHVEVCNTQTGPIFLTYREKQTINEQVERVCMEQPIYNFVGEDGVRHTVWKVIDPIVAKKIQEEFKTVDAIYIADGHHRAAAAVKVAQKRRQLHIGSEQELESEQFLSVLFPANQLSIYPYNRCVTDLNGYSTTEFLEKVAEEFAITCEGSNAVSPEKKGEYGMYLDHTWYRLTWKQDPSCLEDVVSQLDVSILHTNLMEPVLGIKDPKTDQRIDFIGGIRGLEELERRVHADMKVAFSLRATQIQEVMSVSDEHRQMPPKSTWFEPKLRSGLFLHEI